MIPELVVPSVVVLATAVRFVVFYHFVYAAKGSIYFDAFLILAVDETDLGNPTNH